MSYILYYIDTTPNSDYRNRKSKGRDAMLKGMCDTQQRCPRLLSSANGVPPMHTLLLDPSRSCAHMNADILRTVLKHELAYHNTPCFDASVAVHAFLFLQVFLVCLSRQNLWVRLYPSQYVPKHLGKPAFDSDNGWPCSRNTVPCLQ